ncbi:MAG: sialidase family protein, partial [Verrucomicrobiia bacterium]
MKHTLTFLTALLLAPLAGMVSAQTKAPVKPDPNFIASPADLKARIPKQLRATHPDYVVFVPEVTDTGVNDTGNEHFLVFNGPDGSLMAVWTQSSVENYSAAMPADQHIAFARSTDEGVTWSKPRIIAG